MNLDTMNSMNGKICNCGKVHSFASRIVTGWGCITRIPEILNELNSAKPFILADKNTWDAAGKSLCRILKNSQIPYCSYILDKQVVEPDEQSVGSVFMHFENNCDIIIAVGSGVLNDIGKILSNVSGKPYIIVATAPSMDGYASATSSMTRDGLKISLPSRCADVIIGDTEVLCKAPVKLMQAGLGDMLAKYVSICEWLISHLINGEYYCEQIAQLVRNALKCCIDHADGLLKRDKDAVAAVFEGLVICGVAMNYAGISRPASGVEHYISHVLDMRGIEYGTPVELHGIQCAIGTLIAIRLYEQLKLITPDRNRALAYTEGFSFLHWSGELRRFLGKGAETMIAQEEKERKYDTNLHKTRLEVILKNWDSILKIIENELPTSTQIEDLLIALKMPTSLSQIGIPDADLPMIFRSTKDIRDKYVLSRLAWDLGLIDTIC